MGFLYKLRRQVTRAVDEHGEQIAQGIDTAADLADRKTKGKYSGAIGTGRSAAEDGLDKLDGKDDDDLGRR